MIKTIPFGEIPQLSKTDLAYATQNAELRPFYKYEVKIDSFAQIIEDKKNENINRPLLVEVLKKQYSVFDFDEKTQKNIEKLGEKNTFTVTTAHQPSLFLGPLYFIHKIASTINLARQLATQYPDNQFVPMFVIGGEDHDFEEVNHINLFGKKLVWENEEKGAVGMMSTASLKNVLDELKTILGENEDAKRVFSLLEKSYTTHEKYHTATQSLINSIFGKYGLLVLNTNDAQLKANFAPYILKEILENRSEKLVENTQQKLSELGYKSQAFPRPINLFYLREQLRERIVFEDNQYKVLNSEYAFSREEIIDEVKNHPERFSPNVVLRPVYQEVTLPNLAYIGGGGEIAYWLERQTQFEMFGVNFPMLIRRNSVVWIDEGSQKKLEKLGLSDEDIFKDIDVLTKFFITKNASGELNISQEKSEMSEIFKRIENLAKNIDPTLVNVVAAESTKQLGVLDQLESRIVRAEKQKHEVSINQIKTLVQKFCPNGGLQERFDNFLPFYIKYGEDFLTTLIENLNPLREGFVVIK
jgi:bacillithiol synthase